MECLVASKAPEFEGSAVHPSFQSAENPDGFRTVRLSDYKGKWLYLFFYPFDFTFVCPTELVAMSEQVAAFRERGVEVLGCSVDSKFSHFAWLRTPVRQGGVEGLAFPLLEDLGGAVAERYGVKSGSKALRASFLIDPAGIVQHATVNAAAIGRSSAEHLRIVDAAQFAAKHGEVCPMDWHQGAASMKPTAEGKKQYFERAG